MTRMGGGGRGRGGSEHIEHIEGALKVCRCIKVGGTLKSWGSHFDTRCLEERL